MARKYDILDADMKPSFHTIYEALNDCMGTNYKAWMRASWPSVKGNGQIRVWFPKLSKVENGKYVPVLGEFLNYLEDDGNTMVFERVHPTGEVTLPEWDYELIFAKDPDGDYVFRGAYVGCPEESTSDKFVSKRAAKKVELIGDPVYDIKLVMESK